MLQLYNKDKVKINGLNKYKDYYIESVLKTGVKTLSFLYPSKFAGEIVEEGYIRNKKDEFVVKEIGDTGEWKYIKAQMNVEDLEGKAWEHFNTTGQTIENCLTLACANTGWTVQVDNVTKKRTIRKSNCSTWDIIQEVKKVYRVEIEFDTLNKILKVHEKLGKDKGVYFSNEVNLKALEIERNSHYFYSKIIAIGKTDNEGNTLKVEVENFQYSTKIKTLIWKDERYTDINSLREDATAKLEELSKPRRSYTAEVIDLAKLNDKYVNILDYKIGDTITIISKDKKIRDKQRIVKITEYPDEPHRNSCEIANTTLDFIDIQKEFQETSDTVNNITEDNGTISQEAIKVAVKNLTVDKADINSLNVAVANIGEVLATKVNTTDLNAIRANLEDLIAVKANITDLTATNIKFDVAEGGTLDLQNLLSRFVTGENGQFIHLTTSNMVIDNAAIKEIIAKEISVSDLKASDISTNRFKIVSDNGGIEIVGSTQQFKDKNNRVRIQMGQDTQGNFNFVLRGEDGTTALIDHTGIKEKAIADDLIKENMVAENAIGEKQINYNSIITGLNKDTNTEFIKDSKIAMDLTGQTLEVSFKSLKSTVDSKESRNLLLDSAPSSLKKLSGTVNSNQGVVVARELIAEGSAFSNKAIRIQRTDTTGKDGGVYFVTGNGLTAGKKYTWSILIKGNTSGRTVRIGHEQGGIEGVVLNSNEYTLYKKNFIASNSSFHQFIFYSTSQFDISFHSLKLEEGENPTPKWSPAPEDAEKKIESNTTAINIANKQIDTLVKDTTITEGENSIKLQDFYSTFKQTSREISQRVESVETMKIGGRNLLIGKPSRGNVDILENSKSKYGVSFLTGDNGGVWKGWTGLKLKENIDYVISFVAWSSKAIEINVDLYPDTLPDKRFNITTEPKKYIFNLKSSSSDINNCSLRFFKAGYVFKENLYITDIKLEEGTKDTDWTIAPEDTDSNIDGLSNRMATAEQKLEPGRITQSISEAINGGTASISTVSTVLDKLGWTIKNGAIRILNKANEEVLKGDVNGNLTIQGIFVNGSDGFTTRMDYGGHIFETRGEKVGAIRSSSFEQDRLINGLSIVSMGQGEYLDLGYTDAVKMGSNVALNPMLRITSKKHALTGNFRGIQAKADIRVDNGKVIYFEDNTQYPHMIYNNPDNRLCIYGNLGVSIGYKRGEALEKGITISEYSDDTGNQIHVFRQMSLGRHNLRDVRDIFTASNKRYLHRGWAGSIENEATRVSNLNAYLDSGWYSFGPDCKGAPTDWGIVINIKAFKDDFCQIVHGTNNGLYIRWYVNEAYTKWKAW